MVKSWVDRLIDVENDEDQKSLKEDFRKETEQDVWLKGLKKNG